VQDSAPNRYRDHQADPEVQTDVTGNLSDAAWSVTKALEMALELD
jgi:hypothetical protein